jgi:hypothetical protein
MVHVRSAVKILFAVLMLAGLPVGAQTWQHMPVNGTPGKDWPFARGWNRIVYDSHLHRVLFYGAQNAGCAGGIWANSLWAYDAAKNTWEMKTWSGSWPDIANCTGIFSKDIATHPGDRHPYHTMAYDTLRNRLYIFSGGEDYIKCDGTRHGTCSYNDTYHYDSRTEQAPVGQGWVQDCNPCAPENHAEGAMAYDSDHDVIVMYGGLRTGSAVADTWEYSAKKNAWAKISAGGHSPGNRFRHSIVYDTVNHKIVMFGGALMGMGGGIVSDVWLYDSGKHAWTNPKPVTQPPPVKFPSLAFDSKRGLVCLHTGLGADDGDDWIYDVAKNTWTHLPIKGGPVHGGVANFITMTYDPSADVLVLATHGDTSASDVWQLRLDGSTREGQSTK